MTTLCATRVATARHVASHLNNVRASCDGSATDLPMLYVFDPRYQHDAMNETSGRGGPVLLARADALRRTWPSVCKLLDELAALSTGSAAAPSCTSARAAVGTPSPAADDVDDGGPQSLAIALPRRLHEPLAHRAIKVVTSHHHAVDPASYSSSSFPR